MTHLGKLETACGREPIFSDPFTALNDPKLRLALQSSGPVSRRAFNRLVEIAKPLLRARLQKSFVDHQEAEEVLSETLFAIVTGLKHFRGEARLTTWVYGILQHKICDHIGRLQRNRKWMVEDPEMLEYHASQSDEFGTSCWDSTPETLREHKRLKGWIEDGLRQMSPMDAEAWTLREKEGLNSDSAAERLGISSEAFRVRLFRARQRLTILIRARFQGMQVIAVNPIPTQTRNPGLLKAA